MFAYDLFVYVCTARHAHQRARDTCRQLHPWNDYMNTALLGLIVEEL